MRMLDFHSAKVGSVSLIYIGLVFFLSAGVWASAILAVLFVSVTDIFYAFVTVNNLLLPYTRIMYYDLPALAMFIPPIFGLLFDKAKTRSLIAVVVLTISVLAFRGFAYIMEGNSHGEDIYHEKMEFGDGRSLRCAPPGVSLSDRGDDR